MNYNLYAFKECALETQEDLYQDHQSLCFHIQEIQS